MLTNDQLWELHIQRAKGETVQCQRSSNGIVKWYDVTNSEKLEYWATYRIKPDSEKADPCAEFEKALADGKTVEALINNKWYKIYNMSYKFEINRLKYRIKPEEKEYGKEYGNLPALSVEINIAKGNELIPFIVGVDADRHIIIPKQYSKEERGLHCSEGWKNVKKAECLVNSVGLFYLEQDERSWYWLFKHETGL